MRRPLLPHDLQATSSVVHDPLHKTDSCSVLSREMLGPLLFEIRILYTAYSIQYAGQSRLRTPSTSSGILNQNRTPSCAVLQRNALASHTSRRAGTLSAYPTAPSVPSVSYLDSVTQ